MTKKVDIEKIVSVLNEGGLVIIPTETVYGAMVDATNHQAVKKLAKYKNRPFGKPYSIAVADQAMAEKYVNLNETARGLYQTFLPGPVTIVSTSKHKVAPGVESESGTIGIRIPDYPLVINVIKRLARPLTATSANASYQKRPYKIDDVLENLSEKQKRLIDLIVDVGELSHREPSTVIDTTLDDPAILRQGEIKLKNKSKILSKNEEATQNLGKELWQKYEKIQKERPVVFALEGPMGAGKTAFTKGLAKAMGIEEKVLSPTYDLVLNYQASKSNRQLTHIDAWRMQDPSELLALGIDKLMKNKNQVLAIEWAEKVANIVRNYDEEAVVVWVKLVYAEKENERLISWGVV